MTEFDHELIAALAEGRLPAAEAADLEARVAADPVASAELEAQRAALAALAAARPPALDDLERRRLHRSVADQLDIVLPAVEPATRRRRFNVNWAALATTAAVLLTVALVAPVLSLLNTSDDGGADATSAVAAATTAAGSDESATDQEAADEPEPVSDDLIAAGAPPETQAPEAEAADTAPAPETTSPEAPTEALEENGYFAYARETLPNIGELEGDLTVALARGLAEPGVPFSDNDPTFPCADAAVTELERRDLDPESTAVAVIALAIRDGGAVYVVQLGDADTGRELALFGVGDCALVGTATIE